MSDLVYVHDKETGEVSTKPVGTVDSGVEDWYAYEGDALRPVRVKDGSNPPDAELYLHDEDSSVRPARTAV